MDHLQQRQLKTVEVEPRRAGGNGGRARIDGREVFAVCLMGLSQKRTALANRGGAAFPQEKARPQTTIVTRQKLQELDAEIYKIRFTLIGTILYYINQILSFLNIAGLGINPQKT